MWTTDYVAFKARGIFQAEINRKNITYIPVQVD